MTSWRIQPYEKPTSAQTGALGDLTVQITNIVGAQTVIVRTIRRQDRNDRRETKR